MLSRLIITATVQPATVVTGWLVSLPISARLLVSRTRGSTANGIPKDSTTWESTNVRVGSKPMRQDRQSGAQGDQAAHQHGNRPVQQPLHDHGAGVGAHRRRRQARREQSDREQHRDRRAQGVVDRGVGALDRRGDAAVLQVDRGDQQHRGVHRSGHRHRQHDVQAGDSQQPAPVCGPRRDGRAGRGPDRSADTPRAASRWRPGWRRPAARFRCRGIAAPGR